MWNRRDFIPPRVQQMVGYALLAFQALVFALTEDHVASPYLLAATTALLSLGYLGESQKTDKAQLREPDEQDRESGP